MPMLAGLYGNGLLGWARETFMPKGEDSNTYAKLLLKHDDTYSTCFQDHLNGTKNGLACYDRHNQQAFEAAKAQGREVLVYNIKQEWTLLCSYLGHDVPERPFPRLNDKEYFQKGSKKIHAAVGLGVFIQLCKVGLPIGLAVLACRWSSRRA